MCQFLTKLPWDEKGVYHGDFLWSQFTGKPVGDGYNFVVDTIAGRFRRG